MSNDTVSIGTMNVTNKTDIPQTMNAAPVVTKKGVVADTVTATDDNVAIDNIWDQIAAEVGAAVEAAARARPKIFITNADGTTAEAVVTVFAAKAQNTKTTEPIDRPVDKTTTGPPNASKA